MKATCATCGREFERHALKQQYCNLRCYVMRKGSRRLANQSKHGRNSPGWAIRHAPEFMDRAR